MPLFQQVIRHASHQKIWTKEVMPEHPEYLPPKIQDIVHEMPRYAITPQNYWEETIDS